MDAAVAAAVPAAMPAMPAAPPAGADAAEAAETRLVYDALRSLPDYTGTATRIVAAIKANGGRMNTQAVNHVLYAHRDMFVPNTNTPPQWRAAAPTLVTIPIARIEGTVHVTGFVPAEEKERVVAELTRLLEPLARFAI